MFDIGFLEILMVSVLALLVMGPERLPEAIRTGSLWLARIRRSFNQMKQEIESEVGASADDIRRQLHNETVLKNLDKTKKSFEEGVESLQPTLDELEFDIKEAVNSLDLAASQDHPDNFEQAIKETLPTSQIVHDSAPNTEPNADRPNSNGDAGVISAAPSADSNSHKSEQP